MRFKMQLCRAVLCASVVVLLMVPMASALKRMSTSTRRFNKHYRSKDNPQKGKEMKKKTNTLLELS